jgi:starch phosphorylase
MFPDGSPPPNHFNLPRRIRRLADLAYNLWWTWNHDAERAFRFIDFVGWELARHNPVSFLRQVPAARFKAVIQDRLYLELYDQVIREFDGYLAGVADSWYARQHAERMQQPVAYFSTEFGLHESLPFYAGGLGVLSGDHLKEASDLGLPLVAIGFLYTQGYFTQHITEDGWQEAHYASLNFPDLPAHAVLDAQGQPLTVQVSLPGREVHLRLWRVQVGRVPLYLMDSNVPENQPGDRELSARLYTSELELRISQELILGIGGVRALRELGYNPRVWHMNEGHSAFLALERIRELVAAGRDFEEALERVRASLVFTTHTPVAAGHDEFPLWLIDKYLGSFWPQLGIDRERFLELARQQHPWGETFNMTVLAFRVSDRHNGVSELHGKTARKMWAFLWPGKTGKRIPIGYITNGVHSSTWIARRMRELFDLYLPDGWLEHLEDEQLWQAVDRIPDDEFWEVRRHLKRKLVAVMRERSRLLWQPGSHHPVQVVASGVLLDPYVLTIGFARRFATYKRANLLLHDPQRLLEIVTRPGWPVQIIFAGKAHPADDPGKQLIQEVYRQVKRAEFAGRLVFLEDYDMTLARNLIQGVDVWLNTPRRLYEASGTSGQKAAVNGVLNCSVLDGWWAEGYNGTNGWAIAPTRSELPEGEQAAADADSLYRLLEEQIVPLYYGERSADDLPGEWIGMAKESMRTLIPRFSMRRMVKQYIEEMYLPAMPEPEPG